MLVQVGRRAMDGVESAVSHGGLFARPACMITLKIPKEPEGLIGRKTVLPTFAVLKVGPPEGQSLLLRFGQK